MESIIYYLIAIFNILLDNSLPFLLHISTFESSRKEKKLLRVLMQNVRETDKKIAFCD